LAGARFTIFTVEAADFNGGRGATALTVEGEVTGDAALFGFEREVGTAETSVCWAETVADRGRATRVPSSLRFGLAFMVYRLSADDPPVQVLPTQ
jgi:hypothetical protein